MTGSIFDGCRARERKEEAERIRFEQAQRVALAASLFGAKPDQYGIYNLPCPRCGANFQIVPDNVGTSRAIVCSGVFCDKKGAMMTTFAEVAKAESDDDVRKIVAAAGKAKKGGRNAP